MALTQTQKISINNVPYQDSEMNLMILLQDKEAILSITIRQEEDYYVVSTVCINKKIYLETKITSPFEILDYIFQNEEDMSLIRKLACEQTHDRFKEIVLDMYCDKRFKNIINICLDV